MGPVSEKNLYQELRAVVNRTDFLGRVRHLFLPCTKELTPVGCQLLEHEPLEPRSVIQETLDLVKGNRKLEWCDPWMLDPKVKLVSSFVHPQLSICS